jgi:hypothetical protein
VRAAGLLLVLAAPLLQAAEPAPQLALDPESWDFGRTLKNRVIEKQFTLQNLGDADLVIERISTTCGCAAALLSEKTLPPGKSAILRVTFDTRALDGRVERKVLVRSNDRLRDPLEIRLQATVVRQ